MGGEFIKKPRSVTYFSGGRGQQISVYTNRTTGTKDNIICFITHEKSDYSPIIVTDTLILQIFTVLILCKVDTMVRKSKIRNGLCL